MRSPTSLTTEGGLHAHARAAMYAMYSHINDLQKKPRVPTRLEPSTTSSELDPRKWFDVT